MPEALETERVGNLIVQVMYDDDGGASDPREFDNFTVIRGSHRSYQIGDGEPESDEMRALEKGGIRLLYRWLRRYKGVIAFTKLGLYDHSGVAYYPVEIGDNGHAPFDEAGWDSGVVGYVYITRERYAYLNGDTDPFELVDSDEKWPRGLGNRDGKITRVMSALKSEVQEWSDWANGNVYGYTVTKPCPDEHHEDDNDEEIADCPHSEVLDSCWGFIGETDYALSEGKASAEYLNEHQEVPT